MADLLTIFTFISVYLDGLVSLNIESGMFYWIFSLTLSMASFASCGFLMVL